MTLDYGDCGTFLIMGTAGFISSTVVSTPKDLLKDSPPRHSQAAAGFEGPGAPGGLWGFSK